MCNLGGVLKTGSEVISQHLLRKITLECLSFFLSFFACLSFLFSPCFFGVCPFSFSFCQFYLYCLLSFVLSFFLSLFFSFSFSVSLIFLPFSCFQRPLCPFHQSPPLFLFPTVFLPLLNRQTLGFRSPAREKCSRFIMIWLYNVQCPHTQLWCRSVHKSQSVTFSSHNEGLLSPDGKGVDIYMVVMTLLNCWNPQTLISRPALRTPNVSAHTKARSFRSPLLNMLTHSLTTRNLLSSVEDYMLMF